MKTRDHEHAAEATGRPEGAQGLSNPQAGMPHQGFARVTVPDP